MTQNSDELEVQVVNLVKAAMSGDEEANETISQIIDAAEKGDEEAIKIVSIIKQLTQSAQSQPEEATEAMKCGGKVRAKMKAKKCETGGEVLEEKCGGAAKKNSAASKVRKSCKAKKCENGDTLTDTQKFLLGAKCGAKMKKPKKCESGDHIEELEDYLAVKCGGKMKKTKKHEEGGQISIDFSQIDFAKCGKKLKKKEDGGEIAEEKCGGKAKKVKKGEVGVRLPEGAHGQIRSKSISAVFAKGGNTCPCALKRVGGKIVTVDSCTGLPVHKQGGSIKKYQDPAEPITYNNFFGNDLKYDPNTKKFYIGDISSDVWEESSWDKIKDKKGSQELITKMFDSKYFYPTNGLYIDKDENTGKVVWSKTGRFPSIYSNGWLTPEGQRLHYDNGNYIINPGKDNEETLDFDQFYNRYPTKRSWLSDYNNVGYRGEEIPYNGEKAQWDPAQQKYVYKIYRTVSAPATDSEESMDGSASSASQSATAAAAGSSTTAQQGTATSATSTSTGASSQSGSKQNFAEWLKQNASQYQSYSERKKLADKYGIRDYKGSLQQNLQLWDRMKNDQTLNSQASLATEPVREINRIAPLNNPLSTQRKIEIPTINSADIVIPQSRPSYRRK